MFNLTLPSSHSHSYKAPSPSLHFTNISITKSNMANQKVFALAQVAQHKSNTDCWFIINGRVLDVTKFLEEHPGGAEVLVESAGKDATKEFEDIGHSKAAKALLLKYQVGVLKGFTFQEEDATEFVANEESSGKQMSAFVIKDDGVSKYSKFVEIFIPLLVAGFYFGYRCLNREVEISY